MNTLSANLKLINEKLENWEELKSSINRIDTAGGLPVEIEGLQGALGGCFAVSYLKLLKNKKSNLVRYAASKKHISEKDDISTDIIIIVPSEKEALEVRQDVLSFMPDIGVMMLPWWGTVPYRAVPKGAAVFGERAAVLSNILYKNKNQSFSAEPRVFIINEHALLTPVPPPEYISSLSFSICKGQELDTVELTDRLIELGYTRVPKVCVKGEFSLRGEVLDIFLPANEMPVRISFDFTEIEKIRTFDPDNQATVEEISKVVIFPMKEIIWKYDLLDNLKKNINNLFFNSIKNNTSSEQTEKENLFSEYSNFEIPETAKKKLDLILAELEINKESEGEELFYSLVWDKKYSILDYLENTTPVIFYEYDRLSNSQENIDREFMGMYKKLRDSEPVLSPEKMLFKFHHIEEKCRNKIYFKNLHTNLTENDDAGEKNLVRLNMETEPARSFFGNINYLKEQMEALQKENWNIFIFSDNENQSLRINELLKDFTQPENKNLKPVRLIPSAISSGFSIPSIKLMVIQENEIFGRRKHIPKSIHHAKSQPIDTFVDLNPGDYVVHVNYGIGIFKGIDRIKVLGNEKDCIKLEYADNEYVMIPIEQVNLIQRYIGNEGNNPRIDKIGGKSWENRKSRVKKSVEELAHKLIDLYSRRKAAKGFPFPKDTEWQTAFEAAFPYEDTADQITVTQEIKEDMEKAVPMDRLVCGDVGYGKTEIAMRAAFKAVLGGKQVAFLAPTTILAEQHFETCTERFKNFPVTIAHMSRFVTPKEQKKILEKVSSGEVDILVGTHRIIQKDVKFKNLGLMIIDEEQRFGVKDKEKLKELKNNIDCLTMSATPIPRTLHMSLLKIRDMSLLTTPPQNRQPIETVISEFNEDKLAEAVRSEVERGGQVFFLHNRVETLEETRIKLERLLPEMMIDTAHGQMTSEQLDDIFRRFKMGGFHILVATTIIENGIDIPNVNTIIIDRADMYGISQLYQLRGRVGRSGKKAYAYMFYPKNKVLSEIAMKRLQVISDFTELGSGFKIAMKDMEIRGAGNLLGKDQSGDVYSVGFDMYLRLLNEAVERLTAEKEYIPQHEVLMELEYTGFIPDTYVQNPQIKMEIYKKIAAIQEKYDLDRVYNELQDRFGPIPDEVTSLLTLAEIRITCKNLFISKLKERNGIVNVEFAKVSDINVNKVLRLIAENNGRVKLDPKKPNLLILETGKIGLKEKSAFICEKLEFLESDSKSAK